MKTRTAMGQEQPGGSCRQPLPSRLIVGLVLTLVVVVPLAVLVLLVLWRAVTAPADANEEELAGLITANWDRLDDGEL